VQASLFYGNSCLCEFALLSYQNPMIETGQLPEDPEAGVIEKICLAFPFTAPPAGESLVNAEIEHLKECDECREAQQFFTGKSREIILSDERNFPHLVNAFSFFTSQVWHYYLPVFLIQSILRQRYRRYDFWHYEDRGLIKNFWSQRIQLLDGLQCEAILDYLELCRQSAIESGSEARLDKIIEWWESIRREKGE
jgi:hypothetical protein